MMRLYTELYGKCTRCGAPDSSSSHRLTPPRPTLRACPPYLRPTTADTRFAVLAGFLMITSKGQGS